LSWLSVATACIKASEVPEASKEHYNNEIKEFNPPFSKSKTRKLSKCKMSF